MCTELIFWWEDAGKQAREIISNCAYYCKENKTQTYGTVKKATVGAKGSVVTLDGVVGNGLSE